MIEQRGLVRILADVGAADRDGHDLRARSVDRRSGLPEILVLARADEKPRAIRPAGNDQRVVVRESYVLVGGVHRTRPSTAADGADDLDTVTVGERRVGKSAFGHDLSIALDRHALAFERKLADQVGNRCLVGADTGRAVNDDREHGG